MIEVCYDIPVKTKSKLNIRGGPNLYKILAGMAKKERETAQLATRAALGRTRVRLPLEVTMTRVSPAVKQDRSFVDDDNLRSALKSVRDGIALAVGHDDGDPRIRFEYCEAPGRARVRQVWRRKLGKMGWVGEHMVRVRLAELPQCQTCGGLGSSGTTVCRDCRGRGSGFRC